MNETNAVTGKTIRQVIRELEAYQQTYGDIPCYVGCGDDLCPVLGTCVGNFTFTDESGASTNTADICIIADVDTSV